MGIGRAMDPITKEEVRVFLYESGWKEKENTKRAEDLEALDVGFIISFSCLFTFTGSKCGSLLSVELFDPRCRHGCGRREGAAIGGRTDEKTERYVVYKGGAIGKQIDRLRCPHSPLHVCSLRGA